MTIRKKITALALGGTVLLSMASAAFAAQAVATGNVNVRSGPSSQYQRIGTLQRNQLVEVTGCRGGWCYVQKRGPDGWVSARYLQPVRSQYGAKPSINFSFSFGTAPRPPRPDHDGDWHGGNGDHGGWDGGWNGDWDGPRRPRDWN